MTSAHWRKSPRSILQEKICLVTLREKKQVSNKSLSTKLQCTKKTYYLRYPLWRHKAGGLDHRQACYREQVYQLDFHPCWNNFLGSNETETDYSGFDLRVISLFFLNATHTAVTNLTCSILHLNFVKWFQTCCADRISPFFPPPFTPGMQQDGDKTQLEAVSSFLFCFKENEKQMFPTRMAQSTHVQNYCMYER